MKIAMTVGLIGRSKEIQIGRKSKYSFLFAMYSDILYSYSNLTYAILRWVQID